MVLPEEPRRKSRREQRCKVAKTARGMLRAHPSEGERITDFGVDAEIECDCGCVTGSFDKIAHPARPVAVGIAEMTDGYSEEILELFL